MFINATGFYVPEERVDNQHFLELNGLTSEWIEQRTGIRSRSKAKAEENINTMSMEAVRNALPKLPYDITDVDLIVSASYSPYDTVATAAHLAQHEFHKEPAGILSLACRQQARWAEAKNGAVCRIDRPHRIALAFTVDRETAGPDADLALAGGYRSHRINQRTADLRIVSL